MTKTMREQVLDEAKRCVLHDRNLDYDSPENNFQRIADLWNVYLGDKLTEPILPHDTAMLCIMIKIARVMSSPKKFDHYCDIAGYAATAAECIVNKPEPGHEREAWDWSEVFKDMGAPSYELVDLVDAETGEQKYRAVVNKCETGECDCKPAVVDRLR